MDDELLKLMRSCKIFASLNPKECQVLATKFDKVDLALNEILFHQGDPSNFLYLLLRGKLAAILTTATGETKTIGLIKPGETVGELGTLSNEPRALTIKALTDSVLFKLSALDFANICNEYPSVLYATIHPIVVRSQQVLRLFSTEKRKKHIAIVPANKHISLTDFAEKLAAIAKDNTHIALFSDYQTEVNDPNMSFSLLEEKINQIEKIKKPRRKIIYLLKSYDSILAKICFKNAEMIYVIGSSKSPPQLDNYLIKKLDHRKSRNRIAPELILLHPEGTLRPQNTASWLSLADFALHHHVRVNINKDYQRLIRHFRGKPIGLVLSGGGIRGWAHLGVIQALREKKIPIDIIGGASVGALVAACYAMNQSYEDAFEKFSDLIDSSKGSASWLNLTWPAISLFNAKGFTLAQQRIFNSTQIEDLWLPYFCISTNMATNTETVHRSGLLWEKTRSSSAIPGLIPPMVMNGEMHFDGGLLNNLPIDVMKQMVGKRGKVIAVELIGHQKDEIKYTFPPVLTFFQALLAEFGLRHPYKFPRFVDTFFRAILIGSLLKAQQNSVSANLLIGLELSKFGMLHSTPKKARQLIEIGYKTTLEQLERMKLE